jgi:hypothetical protein
MEFEAIYMETVNEPWETEAGREITRALVTPQINKYKDEDRWDSFVEKMVTLKDEILGGFSVINDSQELTKHLQHALHNDLDYDPGEVRALGRDSAGGGTYTAIFHKNDDGDWVKDLALPASGDAGYLAHDDTEDDVDFNHEASRGLWNTWKFDGGDSATWYDSIKEDLKGVSSDTFNRVIERVSKGNDRIVVGDNYDDPAVGYTPEGAKRVAELMNWHENETFNEEMEMIEQATKAYHNNEEPYIRMEMEGGEVTAVPTEEYTGPENLYSR